MTGIIDFTYEWEEGGYGNFNPINFIRRKFE